MTIFRILCLLLCVSGVTLVHAHGPSRQKVTETIIINAPAEEVWALVRDFCSIEQWHPAVHRCQGVGGNEKNATRTLIIGADDGPAIEETLLKHDPEKMMYKYKISKTVNEVLPVTTYSSFVTIKDNGDGTSTAEWRGGFYRAYPNNNPPPELNDEAAVTAVTGTYKAGLEALKQLVEQ
ncbi:MAG: SRPBCC family protein [Gammaproteobacteria bacterium]